MDTVSSKKLNIWRVLLWIGVALVCLSVSLYIFFAQTSSSVALEQKLRCGISEHIHSDTCYKGDFLVCEKTAHYHDGNCYIVLLEDNNINEILTMLDSTDERSLENVINDVVSSALNLNENINTEKKVSLSKKTVKKLNTTISDKEDLPDIVLNEEINNLTVVNNNWEEEKKESGEVNQQGSSSSQKEDSVQKEENKFETKDLPNYLAIGDSPSYNIYTANFYIYLDNKWTFIGTTPFTRVTNVRPYYIYITTDTALELINSVVENEFTYENFNIAVASSTNTTYSIENTSVAEDRIVVAKSTTLSPLSYYRNVRLISPGAAANDTSLAFYTVTFENLDGTTDTQIVKTGTTITMPQGSSDWVSGGETYNAGDAVTIRKTTTFTEQEGSGSGGDSGDDSEQEQLEQITINYDIKFPTISGITVSTVPHIVGHNTQTVSDVIQKDNSTTLHNVSEHNVKGKINGHYANVSRVIFFKGWKIEGTDIVVKHNTKIVWEELMQYQVDGEISLTAQWAYQKTQTVSFFLRFDSVAVDTEGNIAAQPQTLYTKELFATHVGGIADNATPQQMTQYELGGANQENSFTVDSSIRDLVGPRSSGAYLDTFPLDDDIFVDLVEYANTGYLSVDGKVIKAEELSSKEFAVRWYVFKYDDSDCWHIDGKLVRKQGLIHVYKTFAGNKELFAEAKSDFYIDATDVTTGETTVLDMSNYTSFDSDKEKYMWEITDVKYGDLWRITEHPHQFSSDEVQFSVHSAYTIMDAEGDQSHSATGTSIEITGVTYALDEGTHEVLKAEFTNIYNRSNSIIIKKQDSVTDGAIVGAKFRLLQNGHSLRFNYDATTEIYTYDPQGSVTVLENSDDGYFELSVEKFNYDDGPITVHEVSAPEGYNSIGDIEIGYIGDGSIGIVSGENELVEYYKGILIIGNTPDTMSVIAKKDWQCPEDEWQPVTFQLLANGQVVSSVVPGVTAQVVLNKENNWQYRWDDVPQYVNGEKVEWSVREILIGHEHCRSNGTFPNWLVTYEVPVFSVEDDGTEVVTLTVDNTTMRILLRLIKTNMGKTDVLSGATFKLEAVDDDGNVITSEIVKVGTTELGVLIFDNLKEGVRYRLTETEAPEGYLLSDEYIYLTINTDGTVSVENSYYAEESHDLYTIVVKNSEAIALPESGGIGYSMLYALGALLCLCAAGIYIEIFRKNNFLIKEIKK